jgi:hypothetical protein
LILRREDATPSGAGAAIASNRVVRGYLNGIEYRCLGTILNHTKPHRRRDRKRFTIILPEVNHRTMLYGLLPPCARQVVVRPFVVDISEEEPVRLKTLLTFSEIPGVCYENSLPGGSRSLGLPREWLIAAKRAWENEFNWYSLPSHARIDKS